MSENQKTASARDLFERLADCQRIAEANIREMSGKRLDVLLIAVAGEKRRAH